MASTAAYQRSRDRVVQICGATTEGTAIDDRALRQQVLDEVRRVVGFDAYAWLLTDPETAVGTAPLADVPCLPELPSLVRLKYLTEVNRWTSLTGSVALLKHATGGELGKSLLWREMLQRYDVADVASCVFQDRFGCWGFLDLWRSGASEPFSPAEAAFLSDLTESVTAGLRGSQAATFVAGTARAAPPGPVVLLLSPRLDVLAQTPETEQYLKVLVPPSEQSPPIPASVYNVAAALLAMEAEVAASPPWARVHLSGGLWVTLRAARIGTAMSPGERDIAVTIETTSPTDRAALFTRAVGLSDRERELVGHLAAGCSTQELARRMFLSEHTVQDHLKAIFTKAGVRNRRTLMSRALGG